MECGECKENKEVYECDGCKTTICKQCGKLTSTEVKVLQLSSKRVLKFFCTKCKNNETFGLLHVL